MTTPVRLEVLTPFHYHSLAVPGGTATLAGWLADRVLCYGLCAALGGLWPYPTLPTKGYARDLKRMPWLASVLENDHPRLLPPQGRRTNLDTEGGYGKQIMEATGSGNFKTWYSIQEVPAGSVFHGAVFGQDPFALAEQATGQREDSLVFRIGKSRSGTVRVTRGDATRPVRMNVHTGHVLGHDVAADPRCKVELMALYEMQITPPMPLDIASNLARDWTRAA